MISAPTPPSAARAQADTVSTVAPSQVQAAVAAAMESFFALPQKNVLDRQSWATRQELRPAIVTWIERTYHRSRRQRRLGKLTPIEFETINSPHAA